jgi:hypothetical protein
MLGGGAVAGTGFMLFFIPGNRGRAGAASDTGATFGLAGTVSF